jgi:hypothetical protein
MTEISHHIPEDILDAYRICRCATNAAPGRRPAT